ncbi:hypothetical protein BKA69DRAFT_180556 [Paraphysoderma sedebokerense]|nr:hypothetical protein BKA69DRAFT_180556 [Paraphysoderma sedebokerense]
MSSNECAALVEIHNAFNPQGGVLPKWTTTVPPGGFVNGSCCDWQWTIQTGDLYAFGVSCDPSRSTVTYLRLNGVPNGYELRGTIPPDAIVRLTGLRGLEIGGNPMTGTIPPELGKLTSLTYLHIQRNSISGSLPSEIASLTNLRALAIDYSKMTGLPKNFGSLSALMANQCWLQGIQDSCRPNPYPTACSDNTVNLPMNTLPPCPLYTETISTTGSFFSTTTATQTSSFSDSFTTRSLTVGPTSVSTETSTVTTQIPSQSQPSLAIRQQRYIIFGSLLGVIGKWY